MLSSTPVTVVAQHTVTCSTNSSFPTSHRLGPLDSLVTPLIPIAVVFIYEQVGDAEIIPVERLRRALELVLDYYPLLTGRLQLNPTDGTREVVKLGSGAELFVANCAKRLDEFTSASPRFTVLDLPDDGNALLAPFDFGPEALANGPVFTIQHTRFACGAVALGVRVLHTLTDADGFFQLVGDLALLYRQLGTDAKEYAKLDRNPHCDSYLSELMDAKGMADIERKAALEYQPPLYHADTPQSDSVTATVAHSPTTPPPPVTGRFLHFTAAELDVMKAHAADPTGGKGWVSTYDALAAHLYRVVYRARVQLRRRDPHVEPLSFPDFLTPVNIRSRLGPEYLPPRYFGNALLTTFTSISHEELFDGPLWKFAKAIHELTRQDSTTSKEEMNKTLKWMAAQPDIREVKQGFRFGNGSFMISQWNKTDMYEGAIFDTAPLLVQNPFTVISLIDGLAYTLPTKAGNGDVDVALSLSEPLWDAIFEDGELNKFRRSE